MTQFRAVLTRFLFTCSVLVFFFGQCSELCGANHGFIPIVVESVSFDDFIIWLEAKISEILFII